MSTAPKTFSMKLPTVKNKSSNNIQITAEQILKDSEMHREQPTL